MTSLSSNGKLWWRPTGPSKWRLSWDLEARISWRQQNREKERAMQSHAPPASMK